MLLYWFPPLGGGVFADGRVQEVRSPFLQALLGPFAAPLTLAEIRCHTAVSKWIP